MRCPHHPLRGRVSWSDLLLEKSAEVHTDQGVWKERKHTWPLCCWDGQDRNDLLEHVGDGKKGRLAGEPPRFAIGVRGEIPQEGGVVVDPCICLCIETMSISRSILWGQGPTGAIENCLWKVVVFPGICKE